METNVAWDVPTLKSAIEGLYRSFKRYPLRPHVDGCPHCVADRDHAILHSAPLRDLNSQQLSKYAFKAITTWGDADDFRHFLPRLFELLAQDADFPVELEVVTGKLVLAGWNEWPSEQRSAIRDYFQAWWVSMLASNPVSDDCRFSDEVICAIGCAEADLSWYLVHWLNMSDCSARHHLANLVCDNYSALAQQQGLRNAFWTGREHQRQQVENWLATDGVRQALEDAAAVASEDRSVDKVRQAIDYLDWLHA
jgi:hypothetical protein